MTDVKRALAQFIYDSLETRTRDNGDEFVTRKDSAPEWVQNVCQEAHDGMMPDDWRYGAIQALVANLSDNDSDEWENLQHGICDDNVDVYNAELLNWVSSNLTRAEYVSEAVEEMGVPEPFDLYKTLQYGQYREMEEVYSSLVSSIEERAEDLELWSAGWNMCGYMSDMEPATFADFEDAREFIVAELEERADSLDKVNENDGDHVSAVSWVEKQESEFSVNVLGSAYWVQKRDIADALKD